MAIDGHYDIDNFEIDTLCERSSQTPQKAHW